MIFWRNRDILQVRREGAVSPGRRVHLPVGVVRPQGIHRIIDRRQAGSSLACHPRSWGETLLGGPGQVGDMVRLAGVHQQLRGGLDFLAQLAAEERLGLVLGSCRRRLNRYEALLQQSLCDNHLAVGGVDIAVPEDICLVSVCETGYF